MSIISGFYEKGKTTVRSSTDVLTTSYVAGTEVQATDCNQGIIEVEFTIGSLTSAELKIEYSSDGSNYFQETSVSTSISSNTAIKKTYTAYHQFLASGSFRIPIPIMDRKVKVSVKGTGTTTGSQMQVYVRYGTA